jgi:outer membrane autotransporter protein
MTINTKPLLIAIAVSIAISHQAIAAYTPTVNSGTTVEDETIQGVDSIQQVYGTANRTTILSGVQNIYGIANDTIISGGKQIVIDGGVSNWVSISSGDLEVNGEANHIVANGGIIVVDNGSSGIVDPNTGGKVTLTMLSNGAVLENRFGIDNDTIVNSGGMLETGSDLDVGWVDTAISNNAIINGGGLQTISNGGTSNGSTINAGGSLSISSGYASVSNIANNTIVYGSMSNNGGIDNGTIVKSGGTFSLNGDISNNQKAISNNALIEDGANVTINENAQANGWTINGKNTNVVLSTDTSAINDSTLNSSSMWLGKGTATNTILNDSTMVNAFGTDINTVVNSQARYLLDGDATTTSSNLTVNNGGIADIFSGTANDTVVKSGGTFSLSGSVSNNQIAISNNAIIEDGAAVSINENAQANGWTINGKNTNLVLSTDTSTINDSTLNSSSMWLAKGTSTNTILNDSTMINAAGKDNGTVVNSQALYLLDGDITTTSSNLTVNKGGTADIYAGTLTDATINGNMVAYNSIASPTIIQGNISVNDGGKLTLTSGVNTKNADVTISDSGGIYISGDPLPPENYDFNLGSIAMNGGSIHFNETGDGVFQSGYSSLTLGSLDGTGSLYMNTNIAGLQGDYLTVNGQANGDFNVYIADTGTSPTSSSSLQIIKTEGGNADFTLGNNGHVVDVGTYQYYLVPDGKGDWALSSQKNQDPIINPDNPTTNPENPTTKPETGPTPFPLTPTITPSTAAVLSMATVDPLIFQSELSSVRSRLDQVRSFSHDTNVWGHYTTSSYNVGDSAGANYGMHVNGVAIGADRSKESDNGVTTQGIFFSYSHSDVDFDRGGDGKVDSYSVGAYASYIHNSGFYFDGVVKINRFDNDVNAKMTSGVAANGDYDTTGVGVNLQGGKYFYFGDSYITPYASITGFTSNTSDYALSNDMKAHVSPQRSVIGEAGVGLGHTFVVQGAQVQPYLKLAITQELIDDNAVKVNDDHFTNDLSGTRGVYQLGINAKVTERLTVHADASYAQGNEVEAPWTANLGVSWSF